MAITDIEAGECHGQGEGNITSFDKAGAGAHAKSTSAGQKRG